MYSIRNILEALKFCVPNENNKCFIKFCGGICYTCPFTLNNKNCCSIPKEIRHNKKRLEEYLIKRFPLVILKETK